MKKHQLYLYWIILIGLILFSYRNHFDNDFHFDDGHTIQNNAYIRDIHNIPKFFVVGSETFSTLPANQLYRPMVSTSLALDYWLSSHLDSTGNGYNTHYYHWSMMLTFLLLLWFLYKVLLKVFEKAWSHEWNSYIALGATAIYGMHTVNAETLNYIISRSDLLSSLFVLISFYIFLYFPQKRKYALYLIPAILGMLTKLTAAMFGPLLVVYFFLFEWDGIYMKAKTSIAKRKLIWRYGLLTMMLAVFTLIGIGFVIYMQADTYTPGGSSRYLYLITQPFVILHYFISFFVPYNLSADTDWLPLQSILDIRFFVGFVFIVSMFFIAWKSYKKTISRPISFGILWFFITLAPTSSLIPLAEVMNDHRMMYPFIGLLVSVVWSLALLLYKYQDRIMESHSLRNTIVTLFGMVLIAHSFGIQARVAVWDNGKTLWYDVTQKSPKNGRGLMNYGLQLMQEGNIDTALAYFNRAEKFIPYYNYLFTNKAIALNAKGDKIAAEENYKKAISLSPSSHNGYYYYALFLRDEKRIDEAQANFEKVLSLSPQFIFARYALLEIYSGKNNMKKFEPLLKESLQKFPQDVSFQYYQRIYLEKLGKKNKLESELDENMALDKMLELSLIYYNDAHYDKCVELCKIMIKRDENYEAAWNNIISAYNVMGKYQEAMKYGEEALQKFPDNQLLRNNISLSKNRLAIMNRLDQLNDVNQLINLSLEFYHEQMYQEVIRACEKALNIDPQNPYAFNNICSAYNAMEMWEKAIEAGEKAIEYKPDFELAKNNIALAKSKLK